MCHHHAVLVYLTCSFDFLLFLGSLKDLPEQLAIDSYLAVELMVLLIVGRRLLHVPDLSKSGCSKQAPVEVAISDVSA